MDGSNNEKLNLGLDASNVVKGFEDVSKAIKLSAEQMRALNKELREATRATVSISEGASPDRAAYLKAIKEVSEALQLLGQNKALTEQANQLRLISDKTKELKNVLDAAKEGLSNTKEEISKTGSAAVTASTQLLKKRDALIKMYEAGKQNTEEFQKLSKELKTFQEGIDGATEAVDFLTKRGSGLRLLGEILSGVAGGYAAVQGAMALFGSESKDLEKALLKVNAAMSTLQGLQQIQNTLQQSGNIKLALANRLEKAKLFLTRANIKATLGAVKATKLFKLALAATGVGLFVVLLGTVIANWDKITERFKKFEQFANGVFRGVIEGAKKFFDQISKGFSKLFKGEFVGAVQEFRKAGKEGGKAYREGFDEGVADAQRRQARKVTKELIDETKRRIQILQASGKKTYALEKLNAERTISLYKEGTDEYKDAVAARDALDAQIAKERADRYKAAYAEEQKLRLGLLEEGVKKELRLVDEQERVALEAARKTGVYRGLITSFYAKQRERILKDSAIRVAAIERQLVNEVKKIREETLDIQFGLSDTGKLDSQRAGIAKTLEDRARALKEINLRSNKELESLSDEEIQQLIDRGDARADLTEKQIKALSALQEALWEEYFQAEEDQYINNSLKRIARREAVAKSELDVEKRAGETELEYQKRNAIALLDIAITAQESRLSLYKGIEDQTEDTKKAIAEIEGALKKLKKQRDDAADEKAPKTLLELLGVAGDLSAGEQKQAMDLAKQTLTDLQDIALSGIQVQIEANERLIDSYDTRIAEAQRAMEVEHDMLRQGEANNYESQKRQVGLMKEQREKALEERKKLQLAEMNIQAAEQAMGLITSTVNIWRWATKAGGPLAIPIATAATAAMFGIFATQQASARKVIKKQEFESGGKVGGKRHSQGGNKYLSIDGNDAIIEIEDGEFVINRKSTEKYEGLIEAINADRLSIGSIESLLKGTGVKMRPETAEKLKKKQSELRSTEIKVQVPDQSKELRRELHSLSQGINKLVENTDRSEHHSGDQVVIRKGSKTTIKKVR